MGIMKKEDNIAKELEKFDFLIEATGECHSDPAIKMLRTLVECGCPTSALIEYGKRMNEEDELKTHKVFKIRL